ncbi:MAG: FAD-dependent oxidoreductase [Nitrospirae bacterium]|nr:MAG: FAD-dependent oxidoreductase [Nitrospirota bacterium]
MPENKFLAPLAEKIPATRCCVVGGGPAGMMLGLLLARAGVDVVVLEKHADFLRDFRGDTIHPSTLELMHELGVLEEFLKLPHEKARLLKVQVGDTSIPLADFSHLPTQCKFIALMPQWDFLNFLAEQGARYPTFHLRQKTEATGLIEEEGRVAGVCATTSEGSLEIRADLVVGADGRHSVVREKAGFRVQELGAPMDVLWFRISRQPGDPEETMGRFDAGRILIMINRGPHWQFGYIIMKGSAEENREQGIEAFREAVATLAPFAADRKGEIRNWDDLKLLTVRVDRLLHWYRPGLLCIGDAAHAMSPIGGVGVNLAVQDGVAAANLLAEPLRKGRLTTEHLRRVQQRRLLPTRIVQGMQVLVQKQVVTKVLSGAGQMKPPLLLKLFARFPFLRRIPARLIGVGVRPEHVRTPAFPGH